MGISLQLSDNPKITLREAPREQDAQGSVSNARGSHMQAPISLARALTTSCSACPVRVLSAAGGLVRLEF